MRERPILFSAPMVRAILDGTKTQTRRIMQHQPPGPDYRIATIMSSTVRGEDGKSHWVRMGEDGYSVIEQTRGLFTCPYGQPGDRLWGRESLRFVAVGDNRHHHAVYAADGERVRRCPDLADWACDGLAFNCARSVPSIHMPRWASRITLEITGVRVERLQQITEGDARAEGLDFSVLPDSGLGAARKQMWIDLWESINGAGSWDANPWVWVVEFQRAI